MGSDSTRTVALAGDPGGANALAPVIERLISSGRRVSVLGYRQAVEVWEKRRFAFETLPESLDAEGARSRLARDDVGLLLTATSSNGVDLEKRFLAAARSCGVPSLTVLDAWCNYRVRFADDRGALAYLPDRIAVMDARARDEMVAEGFDAGRLVITGQPAFDELGKLRGRFSGRDAARTRSDLGVGEGERMVLFASQPIAGMFGADASSPGYLGYTEGAVLSRLTSALGRIAGRRHTRIVLVVRPHPRENASDFVVPPPGALRTIVDSQQDRHEVAMASDLVTGMNSIVLVEACLLRCIVVSLQPGLVGADTLPTTQWGVSRAVYHEAEIEPTLERLLFDAPARLEAEAPLRGLSAVANASERVVDLIASMARATPDAPTAKGGSR